MLEGAEGDRSEAKFAAEIKFPHIAADQVNKRPDLFTFGRQIRAASLEHGFGEIKTDDLNADTRRRDKDAAGAAAYFENRSAGALGLLNEKEDIGALAINGDVIVKFSYEIGF